MSRTFAALALTATLLSPAVAQAQDAAPQRYAVELQVIEAGKDVVMARTFVSEDHVAALDINASRDTLSFEANLFTVQGDGDEAVLAVEINLVRNGEEIAAPRLMFKRGGTARYETMNEDEGVRITFSPAP